jgi:signal transduction histidine kinase
MGSQKLSLSRRKLNKLGLVGTYLVFAAVLVRTFTYPDISPLLMRYLGLELVYLALFTAAFFIPLRMFWLLHLYLVVQCALVLMILSLFPQFDFVILLFLLLSYQASYFFSGRVRWSWIVLLVLLTGGPLMYFLGFLQGLALALITMAAEIVISAFIIVNEEIETARTKSQILLDELREAHQKLKLYADQVEELTTIQERNRVARTLHDTVSQLIFSISLTARSAEYLLIKDPKRLPEELEHLKAMTSEALTQLRSLIIRLRPAEPSSDNR